MKYSAHVLNGPLKGESFSIEPGFIIGRSTADISIKDPKSSSRHAQILLENDNLILADIGSRNGIKVDGKKIKKVNIFNGLVAQIGETLLRFNHDKESKLAPILSENYDDKGDLDVILLEPSKSVLDEFDFPKKVNHQEDYIVEGSIADIPLPNNNSESHEKIINLSKSTWKDYFFNFSEKSLSKISNLQQATIAPFVTPVKLTVLRGLQYNNQWILGYGPRTAGKTSLDIPLAGINIPENSFTIYADKDLIKLSTPHTEKIKVNNNPVSDCILNTNDIIEVGNIHIQVEFINEFDD